MNPEQAASFAKRLAACYPQQHVGDDTIRELTREFLPIDFSVGDAVVDGLVGSHAWLPNPFHIRAVAKSFKEGTDLGKAKEAEDDIIRNVAHIRNYTYLQALEGRLATVRECLKESLDHHLESAGYYATRERILLDMKAEKMGGEHPANRT